MYGMFCVGCRIQESGTSRFFNFKFVSASHFGEKRWRGCIGQISECGTCEAPKRCSSSFCEFLMHPLIIRGRCTITGADHRPQRVLQIFDPFHSLPPTAPVLTMYGILERAR